MKTLSVFVLLVSTLGCGAIPTSVATDYCYIYDATRDQCVHEDWSTEHHWAENHPKTAGRAQRFHVYLDGTRGYQDVTR